MKLICILLASFLLPLHSAVRAATDYDVYLLAGQSNMDGRGKNSDLSEAQQKPSGQVIIYYRNLLLSSEGWKPLAPGFSVPPGYKAKTLPSPTFGPEIEFAAGMLKARPNRRMAFIKGSHGGTSLSKDWNPGVKGQPETFGRCYRCYSETIALATRALTNDGSSFTFRGLLWHQGESDASSTTEVYQQRLTALIARFREDLGQPNLPVVIGEVYDNGKRDTVRAAQLIVSKSVPHTGFASAAGTKTWDAGTHFDAASQILLGGRFAETMLKLIGKD